MKITDVDINRKRIALSVKQTQEVPLNRNQRSIAIKQKPVKINQPQVSAYKQKNVIKENDSMDDALSLLKKKFGKSS